MLPLPCLSGVSLRWRQSLSIGRSRGCLLCRCAPPWVQLHWLSTAQVIGPARGRGRRKGAGAVADVAGELRGCARRSNDAGKALVGAATQTHWLELASCKTLGNSHFSRKALWRAHSLQNEQINYDNYSCAASCKQSLQVRAPRKPLCKCCTKPEQQ